MFSVHQHRSARQARSTGSINVRPTVAYARPAGTNGASGSGRRRSSGSAARCRHSVNYADLVVNTGVVGAVTVPA